MNKTQEILRLKAFAKTLPAGSYLSMLFGHLVPQFERDTTSDLPCEFDVAKLNLEIRNLTSQRDQLMREIVKKTGETRELDQAAQRLTVGLANAKAECQRYAHRILNDVQRSN